MSLPYERFHPFGIERSRAETLRRDGTRDAAARASGRRAIRRCRTASCGRFPESARGPRPVSKVADVGLRRCRDRRRRQPSHSSCAGSWLARSSATTTGCSSCSNRTGPTATASSRWPTRAACGCPAGDRPATASTPSVVADGSLRCLAPTASHVGSGRGELGVEVLHAVDERAAASTSGSLGGMDVGQCRRTARGTSR